MGKKLQGAALRAKKRAHAALEDLQERQAEVFVSETLQADDLFVIDKQGNSKIAAAAANSVKTSKLKKRRMELSAKDQLQVDRLIKSHSAEQLVDMARKGQQNEERRQRVGRKRLSDNAKAPKFDLWDEGDSSNGAKQRGADSEQAVTDAAAAALIKPVVGGSTLAGVKPAHETIKARRYDSSKRTIKSAVIAVDVAKAGQSYRPDPVAHKQLLQTAAQLEVNREQTLRHLAQPLAQGMSDETKALLMNDDDDSSEYDSDDDNNNEEQDATTTNTSLGPIIPRREDKLTRAQRNKQKRLRQEQTFLQLRKRQKKLEKQVGELPVYKKELKKKELQQQQESSKTKVTAPSRLPGQDVDETAVTRNPGRAPTIPLALAAAPSLRSLQPKGSLVQDRLASLMDRNLTTKPTYKATLQRKKRKKSVKGTRNNEANAGGDVVLLG